MKNLYLIGAGGHCVSAIDVIEQSNEFSIKGIFDQASRIGEKLSGYEIVGQDSDIHKYICAHSFFLITVGQIKSPQTRINLFNLLKNLNGNLATVVSPRAYVAKSALVGAGSIIMHDALVNSNAKVGQNCIVNTKALLEHDVVVESHCHISTAAILNGGSFVGEGAFVGSNSTVRENGIINKRAVISAGAFVKDRKNL